VELCTDLIDEGGLKRAMDRAIGRTLRELRDYERDTLDRGGEVSVQATIRVKRSPGTSEHFDVVYHVTTKVPTPKHKSQVKERGGRLLCQPSGSSDGDPDQMLFFDSRGRIIGPSGPGENVDPATGEVVDAGDVAGSIRPAASM
jgi:hypothetical protein